MKTSTALLIGAGVLGGGYILYKIVTPATIRPTGTGAPLGGNTVGQFFAGVGQFFSQIGSTKPGPAPTGTAAAGQSPGTLFPDSGGVDNTQGIDPTTGGVVLPAGQAYGPVLPTVNTDQGTISST